MKVWKNTNTLDGYDNGILFTSNKIDAEILLLGSKSIDLDEFPNIKGIFRAGIGNENVPETKAREKNIIVNYPSQETIDIIYDETSAYTCNLIFRMLYNNIGTIDPWVKYDRKPISHKTLLVIGAGNIGNRVAKNMRNFIKVLKFDTLQDKISSLPDLIKQSDCITLHIPMNKDNENFMNKERLSLMKDNAVLINTARGGIVDENALYKEIKSQRLRCA